MVKILFKWVWILLLVLMGIYLLGPQPEYASYDLKPIYKKIQLKNLDDYIQEKENKVKDLKPDNEARIVWHNDTIAKTEYALVYLHGFSASQEEGDPVHELFAKRYGMNLYLSRLADHGRSNKNTFKNLSPKDLVNSAKEAIAIGGLIGEKIIIMSCSTGGTFSIMLAPDDPRVHSLIMYSPNIDIKDPTAALVTFPWGKQILSAVMGGDYNKINYPEHAKQYWNEIYHNDGILALQSLLDDGMQDNFFKELNIPIFLGCYYKDEEHQDQVVSVSAMERFMNKVKTPKDQKRLIKFPNAGRHVFTSHIMVDNFERVNQETYNFVEEVLKINPFLK